MPLRTHTHRLSCGWQSPGTKLRPCEPKKRALKHSPGTLFSLYSAAGASMSSKPWPCLCHKTPCSPLPWLGTTQHLHGNKVLWFFSPWQQLEMKINIHIHTWRKMVTESGNSQTCRTALVLLAGGRGSSHTPQLLTADMLEKCWFSSRNAKRWHTGSKDARFRWRRSYLFSLRCPEFSNSLSESSSVPAALPHLVPSRRC